MKLNKNSISSKVYKYFYNKKTLPDNLCPYFWKLVLAYLITIIFAPFHVIPLCSKQYREDFKENLFFTIQILIVIFIISAIFNPLLLIWTIPTKQSLLSTYISIGIAVDGTIIFILFCYFITKLIDLIKSISYKRVVTDKVKTDNILISFIKAKYNKYCPQIEWTDKTT